MLVNALNSLEGFNVYGELFIPGGDHYKKIPHPQKAQQDMIERRITDGFYSQNRSCSSYLNHIFSKEGNVGFKLLQPHLKQFPEIVKEINSRNVFKILMYRENVVKRVVSGLTNRWEFYHKELPIDIDPQLVLKEIRINEEYDKQLQNWFANNKHMRISYEELTGDRDVSELDLTRIWNFLNIDMPSLVKSPLRKYASPLMVDRIKNYEEFKKYFKKHAPNLLRYFDESKAS